MPPDRRENARLPKTTSGSLLVSTTCKNSASPVLSGRGEVHSYGVMYDNSVALLQPDQPFNCAIIQLEEDPGVMMFSNLPGTPLDEVPIGAAVRVIFETTEATGQKVPEWELVG